MAKLELQTVPYYLVLLSPGAKHDEAENHFVAHVAFIDEMSQAGAVLLGGSFDELIDGADGGYLLRAASRDEAASRAARDPLVSSHAYTARVIEWQLVGIEPKAIDPRLKG